MLIMWSLIGFVYTITLVYSQQQNTRRPESHDNGHGWDIRLAVPGEPGGDYPTLNAIPRTSFSCSRKSPGYYADVETGCQVFRVCTLGSTYGFQSFLCPNGTLFNQDVYVCDWWMNVNCEKTQEVINDNREKFGNLKLGPQLMNDIKKMLTHPMRNPYDKSIIKSNLVVMQEYKPPNGQLFPNGALISGPERSPSNIYIPAKQRQGYFAQNSFISNDLSFAASTPSSQYIPSSFNGVRSVGTSDNNIEILQQQRQYVHPTQNFNSHSAINAKNTEFVNYNGISQLSHHNQRNIQKFSSQNSQSQRQISQSNSNVNPANRIKQPEQKSTNMPNQQSTYVSKQNQQLIHENNVPQQSKNGNSPTGREGQYNLISSNSPQSAGKTLKFSRIVQKSSSGIPKSRITFKTWIVRPSKSARLVVEPTPYTYNKPTNSPTENRLVVTSPDNPSFTTEKVNFESENFPYIYDKPTPPSNQGNALETTPGTYLSPTEPTLSNRAYATQKFLDPKQSLLNLPPTTYKPASRFYVPPSTNSLELSRQYLSPHVQLPESINYYQNARLVATPTSPALDFTTVTSNFKQTPSFTFTKQSHVNTNHNNLSFADILTKEKLDITVNDIVKNTNEILKNSSPDILNYYRESPRITSNLANNFLSSEFENEEDGKPASQPPRALNKNEKLIATPSTELEPPEPAAATNSNHENTNKLLNLPFFREPVPTNTIERTVSLKISIPETIAEYLFKNDSQSNSDNLEILKTGSSNYLVLTNSHLDQNNDADFVPIGKLIWDKNLNISNSPALVYSFLTDSINTAKAYSNIAKQNIVSLPSKEPYTKNIDHEDIADISNKISQLTSSHYAKGNQKNANLVLPIKSNGQHKDNFKQVTELSQKQMPRGLSHKQNPRDNAPNLQYSTHILLNSNNLAEIPESNSELIYSGQLYKLPVPEVTNKIYNLHNPLNSSPARYVNNFPSESQRDVYANNIKKQPSSDVELISSETSPYPPPLRQLLPLTEESTFNSQADSEHVLPNNIFNTDTGITAQVQDKITGTLPHPLEENKLVTYQKNRSYYLYTKLDDENNDNVQTPNKIPQLNEFSNIKNSNYVRHNDLVNGAKFELIPAIGFKLKDERQKQKIHNDVSDSKYNGRIESFNQRQGDLVTGVDFTILHPTSRKRAEQYNNVNSILYRGPSSYLAPQSSVGSLGETQQFKNNARIEQFEGNNGYSKTIPARQFTF